METISAEAATPKSASPVEKMAFALVYAEDSQRTVAFYQKYFGFVEDTSCKMNGDQIYGQIGGVGIWIGGGYKRAAGSDENSTRATVMLRVKSASELFKLLKTDGVKLYQEKPIEMGATSHWFQFADPDGNVWDVLGHP